MLKQEQREILKQKYEGKCAYCGCELIGKWHADHIAPIVRNSKKGCKYPEREIFENYNPSCASCNTQKNSFPLEQFRRNIKVFVNSLNSYSTQYKFAKRYGLVVETDVEVEFYFEKFERIKNTIPAKD
jgi:5-methylcytosine-specific restriction endonuclease McrA